MTKNWKSLMKYPIRKMESRKRCISYWDDPNERCSNLGEKSFCQAHLFHYKYYSKYKDIGSIRPKSASKKNLILLQQEITARETYKHKAIALECRDSGHDFFIGRLLGEKERMEEILASTQLFTEPDFQSEEVSEEEPDEEGMTIETFQPAKLSKRTKISVDYSKLIDDHDRKMEISYQEMVGICTSLGWSEEEVIGLGCLFHQTKHCGTILATPYKTKIKGTQRRLFFIQQGMIVLGCQFNSNGTLIKEIKTPALSEDKRSKYKLLASWFIFSSEILWSHYVNRTASPIFLWKTIPETFRPRTVIILKIKDESLDVSIILLSNLSRPLPTLKEMYAKRHNYLALDTKIKEELKLDLYSFVFYVWVNRMDVLCKITDKKVRLKILKPDLKLLVKLLEFARVL